MKNQIYILSFFLFVVFFPKNINAQDDSELLSQLFYGASDIVDQAEEFVSLSVDAVWLASSIMNGNIYTGTLTQSNSNLDYWTYSAGPNDKLVLTFANNAVVNFKFSSIDGYVDETADDFKNSHAMDFISEIPGIINLRVQSNIGPVNDRIEWKRTITGNTVIGETKVDVSIVNTGNKKVDVSSGYAFGDYYDQNSGTVTTSYANFSINEYYKTNLGHNSNKGIFVQSREIFTNNSATGDFGSYQFSDARCFWVGGTAFGDSARAGIYNQAIEVYNWSATGQLLKNNQNYGNVSYDRQLIENSNGAYIVANCNDGKNFYLYRVLSPAIISNIKINMLNAENLSQNYPNPFHTSTTIHYNLTEISDVKIKILNAAGQTIELLVSERQPAGEYDLLFNAKNLAQGIYYYKIETDLFSETKKMLIKK